MVTDQQAWVLRRLTVDQPQQGLTLPVDALVELTRQFYHPLTIDRSAAAKIGYPVIVLREANTVFPPIGVLSPREREVAGLLVQGLSNRDISVELEISLATVKDHVHRILDKSGTKSRLEFAAWTKGLCRR